MHTLTLFILIIFSFFFVDCSFDKKTIENNIDDGKKGKTSSPQKGSKDNQQTAEGSSPVAPPVCEGLISQLDIELCTSKDLSWLKRAETQTAYVQIANDEVTWLRGTWKNGEWYGSTWISGIWENGVWHQGTWEDGRWKAGFWRSGLWNGGDWEGGTWTNGLWMAGVWQEGDWRGGVWQDGLWKNGTWYEGTWNGGIWEDGNWWNDKSTWNGGLWKIGNIYYWNFDEYGRSRKNWVRRRQSPPL